MLEIRLNACAPKTSNGSLGKGTRLPNRKVDKKVANLLLKVAQKVATLKNQFKTVYNRFLKLNFQTLY